MTGAKLTEEHEHALLANSPSVNADCGAKSRHPLSPDIPPHTRFIAERHTSCRVGR
jgi:hypothetical protein